MGGTPQYVTDVLGDQLCGALAVSPDGKVLAYPYTQYGPVPSEGWRVAVMAIDGGPAVKQFNIPGGIFRMRWSPSGKGLQYLVTHNGAINLWEQPLSRDKPKQLTRFTTGQILVARSHAGATDKGRCEQRRCLTEQAPLTPKTPF